MVVNAGDDTRSSRLRELFAGAASELEASSRELALAAALRAVGDEDVAVRIGRYVVLERLGRGGMGIVYLAHDPELHRKVALKVVTHASAPEWLLAREGQALARLSHPNVVPVYDLGLHGGRLFLTMEYVEGETLSEWLARRKPSTAEIVDVFLAAGEGLSAAHAAGIVHRDFKPSNVMVGRDGRVRVLDFGIAQALSTAAPGEAVDAGTPAYMAPEQRDRAASAASDQYSFCVSLHEALHGRLPGEGSAGRRVAPALARIVQRGLRGDPAERWPSMDALLARLAAWRRGRLRVWAALVVVSLVAGFAAVGWRERDCAAWTLAGAWSEEASAGVAAALRATGVPYAESTAERVVQRLGVYAERWAEEGLELCRSTSAADERARRGECLSDRRDELRALVGELRRVDAETVERAAAAVLALPDPRACREAPSSAAPLPGDAEVAEQVQAQRRLLAESVAARSAGRFAAARDKAAAAAASAEALAYPPLVAEAHWRLGQAFTELGAHADAERWLSEAYWEALAARQDRVAAEAASMLIFVVGDLSSRPREGDTWARDADAILTRTGRPQEIEVGYLNNAAGLRYVAGDYVGAEAILTRAEALVAGFGPDGSGQHLVVLNSLANARESLGDVAAARDLYARSMAMRAEIFGPDHPSVGVALTNLGQSYLVTGEFEEAELHLRRAEGLWRRSLREGDGRLGSLHVALGEAAWGLGRAEVALAELRRAQAVWSSAYGADDARVAFVRGRVAAILCHRLLDADQARAEAAAAVASWERSPLSDPQAHAEALMTASTLALAERRVGEAAALAERAEAVAGAAFEAEHEAMLAARTQRARVALAAGEVLRARLVLRSIVAEIAAAERPGPSSLWPRIELARAELLAEAPERAAEIASSVVADAEDGRWPHAAAAGRAALARALWALGERCAAQRSASAAATAFEAVGMSRERAALAAWSAARPRVDCG